MVEFWNTVYLVVHINKWVKYLNLRSKIQSLTFLRPRVHLVPAQWEKRPSDVLSVQVSWSSLFTLFSASRWWKTWQTSLETQNWPWWSVGMSPKWRTVCCGKSPFWMEQICSKWSLSIARWHITKGYPDYSISLQSACACLWYVGNFDMIYMIVYVPHSSTFHIYLVVSWNRGTRKCMIYTGKPLFFIETPFSGNLGNQAVRRHRSVLFLPWGDEYPHQDL